MLSIWTSLKILEHDFMGFSIKHVKVNCLKNIDITWVLTDHSLFPLQKKFFDQTKVKIFTYDKSCADHWRGHQTSPTVVSLKGILPLKLQSKSILSCKIVQIHSLFRHGFIKKPKSKFNRNRK